MPTSLIFAALVATWLVVLVPLVAMRRQEVVRTADSALAARVLVRPGVDTQDDGEVTVDNESYEPVEESGEGRTARPHRPGRGGFDPEAAALAAQARYAFRQRVVLALLAGAVGTLLLALISAPAYWWLHGAFDLAVIGYLGYLRRQVQIEEEVRRRRADRVSGRRPTAEDLDALDELDEPEPEARADEELAPARPSRSSAPPPVSVHPRAVALDLDDEDPEFDELATEYAPQYRRAVGE